MTAERTTAERPIAREDGSTFDFVHGTVRDRMAVVTLDRPPVNAVNQQMYRELRELFGSADELFPDASVVVLRAAGKHFCSGNDLTEFLSLDPQNSPGRMRLVREAFFAVYECPVPVIGVVQGMAAGTGVAIAASCDVLVCGRSARFATPEVGVGVMGGARHLARLVPEQLARWMYFTTEPVSAAELLRHGSVLQVVDDDDLTDAAMAVAERIAGHSRVALRTAKEALNTVEWMDLKPGYEFEQRLTARLSGHPDSRESRSAIREKRSPQYGNAL